MFNVFPLKYLVLTYNPSNNSIVQNFDENRSLRDQVDNCLFCLAEAVKRHFTNEKTQFRRNHLPDQEGRARKQRREQRKRRVSKVDSCQHVHKAISISAIRIVCYLNPMSICANLCWVCHVTTLIFKTNPT